MTAIAKTRPRKFEKTDASRKLIHVGCGGELMIFGKGVSLCLTEVGDDFNPVSVKTKVVSAMCEKCFDSGDYSQKI